MPALRPEFGPTLPELLAPRLGVSTRRVRIALLALAALLLAAYGVRKLTGSSSLTNDVLVARPIAFTLGYRDGLERVAPDDGELLRLQTPAGAADPERFTVTPLRLPPYRGDPSGVLPVVAAREVPRLRRAFPDGFRYRGDGRVRVNLLPGHQVLFQTRIAGRTAYGRRVLLLPDEPGARVGVALTLVSVRTPAIPAVDAVGSVGLLKGPLRSFRFGTERP